nr:retrovirus-related Pol polyprotein from transposon TNT 1-94 [Tanacetum cinerariifolium]
MFNLSVKGTQMHKYTEETLLLEDESRSKMLQKQNDPIMPEKKVITKPVDYAALNKLLKDFETRFVPQTELSAEQAFWSRLKKLKFHLASFDVVVKERTTATAITEGTWRFKHTKPCFRDDIIPFVKALKELFNSFDQFLIDELTEVQNVFKQMEQAIEQHVNLLSSVSGSQPQGNTKKDRIQRTPSKAKKNKLEDHHRTVRPSLNKKKSVADTKCISSVINCKSNVNSDLKCAMCNGCLFSNNHDLCVLEFINAVNARVKSKSVKKINNDEKIRLTKHIPTIGNTPVKITSSTNIVSNTPVLSSTGVNLLSSASGSQPQGNTKNDRIQRAPSKAKKNKLEEHHRTVRPSLNKKKSVVDTKAISSVTNSKLNVNADLKNDHVAKIMGYGDYKIRNASKTKSWLWHRRLSHQNFGAINYLARQGLVRGLSKLKFEKDHLCSACAMGKSKKKSHKPKSEDTNQEKLYLLHMDLCGPMRVESVNGKKYILVIINDYSRFTWVKCLRSKDEAPDFIIKFLKMIQVRLKVPVHRIRTDNESEFVNQTLLEYYEEVGISHETSVARSPQ